MDRQRPVWEQRQPTPQDVMRYAENNPIVQTVLEAWKRGTFGTWEEAMTALVCYLADQNATLMRDAVKSAMYDTKPFIIPSKEFSG